MRKAGGKQTEREETDRGSSLASRHRPPDNVGGRSRGDQATVKRARMVQSARVQWALQARRREENWLAGWAHTTDLHAACTMACSRPCQQGLRGPGFASLLCKGKVRLGSLNNLSPQTLQLDKEIISFNTKNRLNYLNLFFFRQR